MNNWVLVTGASQGIGVEIARWFAIREHNLVLVARDEARLNQIANELKQRHGAEVRILPKDLAQISAAQEIFEQLRAEKIEVGILINNAGFGCAGAFAQVELSKHLAMAQVNITTLTQLTHLFLPMLARGEGRILNVASIAAFLPGPFMAMYYASKAFVFSFSRALSKELSGSGVTVTALCLGITQSEFHSRAGMKRNSALLSMDADEVADIGCRALMAGKPSVAAGWKNRMGVIIFRRLPVSFITWIAAKVNR